MDWMDTPTCTQKLFHPSPHQLDKKSQLPASQNGRQEHRRIIDLVMDLVRSLPRRGDLKYVVRGMGFKMDDVLKLETTKIAHFFLNLTCLSGAQILKNRPSSSSLTTYNHHERIQYSNQAQIRRRYQSRRERFHREIKDPKNLQSRHHHAIPRRNPRYE